MAGDFKFILNHICKNVSVIDHDKPFCSPGFVPAKPDRFRKLEYDSSGVGGQ